MAKSEFATFVKTHYEKVKDVPARERLGKLAAMYRQMKGEPAKAKVVKAKREAKGAGLFSDALEELGPIGAPVAHLLGGEMKGKLRSNGKAEAKKTRKRAPKGAGLFSEMSNDPMLHMFGGKLGKRAAEPNSLVLTAPNVPVDRVSTPGVAVPFAFQMQGKMPSNPNPLIQEVDRMRKFDPKMDKMTALAGRQTLQPTRESTDLKTMLGMFGVSMPKHMRNVQPGGKLTKKHLAKIYNHTLDTMGEERGAGLFDDIARGFSTGFTMPFRAIGNVASAIV